MTEHESVQPEPCGGFGADAISKPLRTDGYYVGMIVENGRIVHAGWFVPYQADDDPVNP